MLIARREFVERPWRTALGFEMRDERIVIGKEAHTEGRQAQQHSQHEGRDEKARMGSESFQAR